MAVEGWSLMLPFDTDDEQFVRGFELGRVWAALGEDDDPQEHLMHASNAEMAIRLGEATGREVESSEIGDGWLVVQFGAQTADVGR